MTGNHDDTNPHPGDAPSTARRRLLRGTFAVPTVLTLGSGSALAARSNVFCAARLGTGVDNPPANYFRVQRWTHTKSGVTTKLVKAVDINNLSTNGFDTATYTSGKTWIKISDGSNFNTQSVNPTMESSVFVALRFTNTGTDVLPSFKVTGLANSSTDVSGSGNVLTTSCWASI